VRAALGLFTSSALQAALTGGSNKQTLKNLSTNCKDFLPHGVTTDQKVMTTDLFHAIKEIVSSFPLVQEVAAINEACYLSRFTDGDYSFSTSTVDKSEAYAIDAPHKVRPYGCLSV
jgi:hypothetical protein